MEKKAQKILLADDDVQFLDTGKSALLEAGFEVDVAVDGFDVAEKLNRNKYNLILLDLVMPGKNGEDILRDMRDAGNTTPVVVLTSLFDNEEKQRCLSLGASLYFDKSEPDFESLIEKVENVLNNN